MKNLLFTLTGLLLFISISTIAQQTKGSKEDAYWEIFKNNYLTPRDVRIKAYNQDIKVQLTGNYLPEDTVYADKLISELSGLLDRVKIYRVKHDGNLILKLNTLADTIYEPIPKPVVSRKKNVPAKKVKERPRPNYRAMLDSIKLEDLMSGKVPLMDYYTVNIWIYYVRTPHRNSRYNEEGIDVSETSIEIRQSAPQLIRNKAIQYHITRALLIPNSSRNVSGQKDNSLLGSQIPLTAHFQEKDSFMLSKAYANNIYLQLYKHYPRLLIRSVIYKFGNYTLLLYFIFSIMVVLSYFLVLIKANRIVPRSFSWKEYMKTGMLIMQSATLTYILYTLYEKKIFHDRIYALLGEAIVIPVLFSFVTLNLIYFSERLLIRKNTAILQRLYIQFFISLIPVFFLFYVSHSHTIFMSFVVVYAFLMIIGRLAYTFFNYKTQNAINEKDLEVAHMREMQHSAELQALHSRINPHFLYNALNSIAGLARINPEKTEQMALALSDFCRYTINKNNSIFSTVSEETELAKTYLEIEKTRFGEKLQYELLVNDDLKNKRIPRFVIQPMIENAIKHGVTQITGQGIIKLVVDSKDGDLVMAVYDNGPSFGDNPVHGYGLQSIYDKLEILYKGKACINWQNEPEKFIAVTLPMEAEE